ncbi:MAG: hypothetical protein J0L69_01605 [Bacteroidetes bacterium]|nr:hypothetical protein [Bacteroidota bacterium]
MADTVTVINEISKPYYMDASFWISNIVSAAFGTVGIIFSILSFREAKKAKDEASKAGNTVKIQSIIIDIMAISQQCQINLNADFESASKTLNDISSRVRNILSVSNSILLSENADLKNKFETNLSNIRASINSINPLQTPDIANVGNITFYTLEPHFAAIKDNLGDLKGILESKLLNG